MSAESFADLHLHTVHSDSTLSPFELVEQACQVGLSTIAITDHDTVDGIPEAKKKAEELGIRVIPGVELTAYHNGREIHVVGLFIDITNSAFLTEIEKLRDARLKRVETIARKLEQLNAPIDVQELIDSAGGGSVGRSHLAEMLLQKGHVDSLSEAFWRYLGNDAPCYVPKPDCTAAQAVSLIHEAGGVAVLAHPSTCNFDSILPEILKGFDGIEVFCPSHSKSQVAQYTELAHSLDLALSGGSDDHGQRKEWRLLGQVMLPQAIVDALEERRP